MLIAGAVVIVWAGAASTQTKEEFEAFTLYKASQDDIEADRYDEAIEKLERAYDLFPMPHILARKAEAFNGRGDLEKALDLYRQVKTDNAGLNGRVQKAVSDILYRLNKPVEVQLEPNVDQVEVTVDHASKFMAPCTIKLTRGSHHFEFRKNGYWTLVEEKTIQGIGSQTYSVELREQTGSVVFVTDLDSFDGVMVRMDRQEMEPGGTIAEPSRSTPMKVRAGTHRLLCVKSGLAPYMSSFDVAPNVTVEVTCRLKPPSASTNRTWGWVTLSTGLAAAAAGAGLVGWYYGSSKGNPSHPEPGLEYQLNHKDYHENYYGFALLGLGLVSAGLSVYFFLADDDDGVASGGSTDRRYTFGVAPVRGGAVASGRIRF